MGVYGRRGISDIKAALAWLKQMQGLALDEAEIVEPLAAATQFNAVVAKAAEDLPLDIEPAGFGPLFGALAAQADDD